MLLNLLYLQMGVMWRFCLVLVIWSPGIQIAVQIFLCMIFKPDKPPVFQYRQAENKRMVMLGNQLFPQMAVMWLFGPTLRIW